MNCPNCNDSEYENPQCSYCGFIHIPSLSAEERAKVFKYQREAATMNMQSLLIQLESINHAHPNTGMRMDMIEKEGRIEEFRIEVFSFPTIGVRYLARPATHVYLLKRIDFDRWQRETIRGG